MNAKPYKKAKWFIIISTICLLVAFAVVIKQSTKYKFYSDITSPAGSSNKTSANYSVQDLITYYSVRTGSGSGSTVPPSPFTPPDAAVTSFTTWYLAEGTTRPPYQEWITIQNPNPTDALVTITYMTATTSTVTPDISVGANRRKTIDVNYTLENLGITNADVSAKVECTNGLSIFVERPMYFSGGNIDPLGGHVTNGIPTPATTWYLAEGTTRPSYQEWITIQNPNPTDALVTITYMTATTSVITPDISVAANRRKTIDVNSTLEDLDIYNADVSAKVEATNGVTIIVERPMYFSNTDYDPVGGHVTSAVTSPATTWYLAEGTTRSPYQEWITIQNPNSTNALITVTYMTGTTSATTPDITVEANRRKTIDVNYTLEGLGIINADVSTKVESTNGVSIIVERPMYFSGGGYDLIGGHDSTGIPE